MKTVKITTPLSLDDGRISAIRKALKLSSQDTITQQVDPNLIAGLRIDIDGTAIDMTVKTQLAEIAQGN